MFVLFSAKTAKRLRGYLIRLTREYTAGGMDSRADEEKGVTKWNMVFTVIQSVKLVFRANVRSAVRVFTGEAGVTFALY